MDPNTASLPGRTGHLDTVDWDSTLLGPPSGWPAPFRTAVDISLLSRFPMVLWWGPEHAMLYNEPYLPVLGDKHPAAIGRPAVESWGEVWDVIGPMLDQARAGEATWADDLLLLLDRQGFVEECYFTFSYSPIPDVDGGPGGVFTAVTETTAQVLRERRLRALSDVTERTREIEDATAAARTAVDVLRDHLADVPAVALHLHQDDRLVLMAATAGLEDAAADAPLDDLGRSGLPGPALVAALEDGASSVTNAPPGRTSIVTDGGMDVTPDRWFVQPLLDRGASVPLGVLTVGLSPRRPFDDEYRTFLELLADQIARSLAEAHAASQERERLQALAELNQAKTEFFSNVSHEFRTPLTLLLGPLHDALDDEDAQLPEPHRQRLLLARRNADRLVKLVNTLLDFSRLESGRLEASFQATDLAAATTSLASVFRAAAEAAGLDYVVDTEPLPRPVHVDREMWEKIVLNLLSNAVKFTFEGQVAIRLRDDGTHAVLEVSDTGVGVQEEEYDQLFERFHRVRGARSRTQEGSGIGLALVAELVALHRGTVDVSSVVDEGSTFTVRLPYGHEHLPTEQVEQNDSLASTTVGARAYVEEAVGWSAGMRAEPARLTGPATTGTILVVDDNTDMREYLVSALETEWTVLSARDGQDALEVLRTHAVDVVLTDIMMPRVDGFELLAAIRADEDLCDVPVVMLTARAGNETAVEGLLAGADDYLVKPFTVPELRARIRSTVEMARHRRRAGGEQVRQAMLAGLSHDMQTPLAAILGFIAVVEAVGLSDDMEEATTAVKRQGNRLRWLVQQFLDFSRLEVGAPPVLQLEDLDPVAVVERAIDTCADDRVTSQLDDDLPTIRADEERVAQILVNLLSNGLKFSDGDLPVELSAAAVDGHVEFAVRDRGGGIHPDDRQRVFQKFFRGRDTDEVMGTGLGLFVGRGLAEAMGGSLEVSDTGPGGSTLVLRLPTVDPARQADHP